MYSALQTYDMMKYKYLDNLYVTFCLPIKGQVSQFFISVLKQRLSVHMTY